MLEDSVVVLTYFLLLRLYIFSICARSFHWTFSCTFFWLYVWSFSSFFNSFATKLTDFGRYNLINEIMRSLKHSICFGAKKKGKNSIWYLQRFINAEAICNHTFLSCNLAICWNLYYKFSNRLSFSGKCLKDV